MRIARSFTVLVLMTASAAAQAQTAQEIIAASDKARNPGQPFRSTDILTEFVDGKPRDQDVLVIYAKDDPKQFRNLVGYVQPLRDQGKMALLDGRVLWFYDPNSQASVRISPQQRLMGQASIYTSELLGDEAIQDAERKHCQCWHLDMQAANDLATYNRIEYGSSMAASIRSRPSSIRIAAGS